MSEFYGDIMAGSCEGNYQNLCPFFLPPFPLLCVHCEWVEDKLDLESLWKQNITNSSNWKQLSANVENWEGVLDVVFGIGGVDES